jgi:hypothetical protein
MAIEQWVVIPGQLGAVSRGAQPVPRDTRTANVYGTTVPGNATGVVPPYGQIFPRGKT